MGAHKKECQKATVTLADVVEDDHVVLGLTVDGVELYRLGCCVESAKPGLGWMPTFAFQRSDGSFLIERAEPGERLVATIRCGIVYLPQEEHEHGCE